LSNKS